MEYGVFDYFDISLPNKSQDDLYVDVNIVCGETLLAAEISIHPSIPIAYTATYVWDGVILVDDNSGLLMLRAIAGTCALESGSKPGSGALGASWACVQNIMAQYMYPCVE